MNLLLTLGSLLLLNPVVIAHAEGVFDMDGGVSVVIDTAGLESPRIDLGGGRQRGFDEKYQRDYNIFHPLNKLRPDNPVNPINSIDPNNPFNPLNEIDPGNPGNPLNQLNPNNPFNPLNKLDPDNPLNPLNRYNLDTPFEPLR